MQRLENGRVRTDLDMRDGIDDGALVAENGWRQGSVLPPSLVTALIEDHQIPATIVPRAESKKGWLGRLVTALKQAKTRSHNAALLEPTSDWWMVISQDCDLVQTDWVKEPYVELIRIRHAKDDEHPPKWLTSPRDLQFSDPPDEKTHRFACSIHDRVQIDRKYLSDFRPDANRAIDRENVRRICLWVARRYVRAAFPDAFNERVESAVDSLTKKSSELYKQSDLLSGIYLLVTEAELGPDEDYKVVVWGTMRVQDFEKPDRREVAQRILDLLESSLGSCDGIEIDECELVSEQDLTIDHLRLWKRWDFDVLSLRPKRKNDPLPSVEDLPPDQ